MKRRVVVVTGAGGLIGSAVVRALVARDDCEIRALVGPLHERVRPLPAGIPEVRAEITDEEALERLATGSDVFVHLAGPPSVRRSFHAPQAFVRTHVAGTAAALAAAQRAYVPRFIYISSAEVYGRPQVNPVSEDHPLEARSPYAAAKIGAEQLVRVFATAYSMETIILRPFSVYGPGMSADSLIGAILRQATASPASAIELADLRPVRDYCYVDDVAEAIVLACGDMPYLGTPGRGSRCPVFNVGSGIGVDVAQLAEATLRALGCSIPIFETVQGSKQRPGAAEIYRLIADPCHARKNLGWTARTPLQAGLAATVLPEVA